MAPLIARPAARRSRSATAAPTPAGSRQHREHDVEAAGVGVAQPCGRDRARTRRRRAATPEHDLGTRRSSTSDRAPITPTRSAARARVARARSATRSASTELDLGRRARSATRACRVPRTSPRVEQRHRRVRRAPRSVRAATPPRRRIAGSGARAVDDGGLDPHPARPAVEHDVDVVAEVGAHVGRGGGAHAPEPVGRRRGDAAAERAQQRERDRLVGHAHPDGVEPAGHLVGHVRRTRRTTTVSGPGQHARASARAASAHVDRPVVELRRRRRGARSPGGRRAALHREQPPHRGGRRRVGARGRRRSRSGTPPARRRAARRPRRRSRRRSRARRVTSS